MDSEYMANCLHRYFSKNEDRELLFNAQKDL